MTRTRRFIRGVGLGYASQIILTAAGLWLTPFLLHALGRERYGLWVVATQILIYLGLIDFGIVALVPRTVAGAMGRANGVYASAELDLIIGTTLRIVLTQTLIGLLVAVGVIVFLPAEWTILRAPLGAVLIIFVLLFPLRIAQGVLAGLQDTTYLGTLQIGSWFLGTALTVVLVIDGYGISSLAAGWIATQLCLAIGWAIRIATNYREVLPPRLPQFARHSILQQLAQGGWVSIAQVAQALVAGADILLIARLLGPEYVVVYAMTDKLITVLANQPQMLMQAAVPGLSEMRTSAAPHDIIRAASALTQGMLLVTGLVFCVVMAINHAFVSAWVGRAQYGGFALTALLLLEMLLRHLNTGAVYTIFSFGRERRIAIVSLVDGIVSVTVAATLIPVLGINGAAIGLVVGVTLVSLPANYSALVAVTGTSLISFLRPTFKWWLRFIPLAIGVVVLQSWWRPASLPSVVVAAMLVAIVYFLVMLSSLNEPPLSAYVPDATRRILSFGLSAARRTVPSNRSI